MNMKHTMRELLLVAAIAVASDVVFASGTAAITAEKFPDADSVLVEGFEDIVYNPDGTYIAHDTNKIKILTEKGRREESVIELSYSARYGKSELLSVVVENASGETREIDISATAKVVSDNSSEAENIYDPMHKKLVCTVPGLKVGDVLIYKTRREVTASRIKNQWADVGILEWSCPILKQVIRVKSPAGLPLKKMAIRHPLGNVVSKVMPQPDGSVIREWIMENAKQVFPEPDMPPLYTQVQNLRLSTAEDWREISKWYWQVSLPHLEKTNASISNKVEEIGHDVAAIYKWVAQEIRYMGLTMEDDSPGYAPHDVDITFANRYGVCRDKAALLVAMLRIAGFKAYPVLIHVGAKMDDEVPMPYFNHAVVAVEKDEGGYYLLDPTDESSRDLMPAYLSNRSYLVAKPEGETLLVSPVPDARSNSVKVDGRATLDKDGVMLLESTIHFSGINDNIYRQALLRLKKDARRKLFERQLDALAPGAELLDIEIIPSNLQDTLTPLEVRLVAKIPETLLDGETRLELAPPMLSRCFGSVNWLLEGKTSLETRKYPLVLDSTAMVDETLEIRLEDAVGSPIKIPEDVVIDGDFEYRRSYSSGGKGNLIVKRLVAVNSVEFSPDAYQKTRESIKSMEAAERERPVFAKSRYRGANIRVFDDISDIHISNPFSWVVTNTVTEQVLSYDGKKKYSELKFDYNPSWKNIEFLYGIVSNANGKVSSVTATEMNEFDAAWVASAPRYPASKRLIVNLPGVELGSVISYSYVTTVSNAPAAFYGKWSFESSEPVDHMVLRINGETIRDERDLPMLFSEPMTADGDLWQDLVTVSHGNFDEAAAILQKVTDVPAYRSLNANPWGSTVKSIRNWMAKNVKLVGPSLYETPLDAQLTPIETVLKERYASNLDYIRTLCALLKGAGFEAEIIFASYDVGLPEKVKQSDMFEKPDIRAFGSPIIRITTRTGGWLFFGETEEYTYLSTENEYSELGATPFASCHYFDPKSASFGLIELENAKLAPFKETRLVFYIRENGAVDLDYERELFGPAVAAFRKKYDEMLPEDRQRHYQELLGDFAQAASATSELVTDVVSYPAKMSFKAYIPDYAVVNGDTITITLATFLDKIFPLTGGKRRNPIGINAVDGGRTIVEVVFPEGYTIAEHLPESFTIRNPLDHTPDSGLYVATVKSRVADGRLRVSIERTRAKMGYLYLASEYAPLLRDWSSKAASRANRTISARKPSTQMETK